jgi:hypothetical protein
MGKKAVAAAAAQSDRSEFTLRLDAELTAKIDSGRANLAREKGFQLSRNQYIEWILRRYIDGGTESTT